MSPSAQHYSGEWKQFFCVQPRKGCFEIRDSDGTVFVSLQVHVL